MMMKKFVAIYILLFTSLFAFADEGMWIPSKLKQLNEQALKERGLRIPVESIYDAKKPSLKDAIVHFGGGCTAEVVSYQGLILTNHHCGYSQIQSHSSLENDYLKNGFWAMSKQQELPNPGLTATFIISMEEVTDEVLTNAVDQNGEVIYSTLRENAINLAKKAVEGTHYEAEVKAFNYGNDYFLIITETFKDVRLVGAPPSSIGKYGGDTDNWVWPRHTGDFSVFRIYADKDNKPAEYSADNVPYKPKYALPVSMRGVEEGDFTMVFGFPGRTQQYLPSYAVDYVVNRSNPVKIKMRETSLSIIDAAMRSSDLTRIQYAAKQSRISNAYKKWIGESGGLKQGKALSIKQKQEKELLEELANNPVLGKRYGHLLNDFKKIYEEFNTYGMAYDYFVELFYFGPEVLRYSYGFEKLTEDFSSMSDADRKAAIAKISAGVDGFFKNYDAEVDKKIFKALFPIYINGVPEGFASSSLKNMASKFKGDWSAFTDDAYSRSLFADKEKVKALLANFNKKAVSKVKKDPLYLLSQELVKLHRDKTEPEFRRINSSIENNMRMYVQALMAVFTNKKYWLDANSTLRLSYGIVDGSAPHDGMKYTYFTTMEGIMQKYVPGDAEFDLPAKLIELYNKKDYGNYAHKDGSMRVCFTASNQTTGGNSGSPVLDADGYLIGINFDRSWESTMSDIMYDPSRCRNITLDIRYVLFVIDKLGGAGHLVEEMELMTEDRVLEKKRKQMEEQIRKITDEIRARPGNSAQLVDRGRIFLEMEAADNAMMDADAAIKLDKKSTGAYLLKGDVFFYRSKYKEALTEYDKVIALEKEHKMALFQKGICLMEMKNYPEALKVFTLVINIDRFDSRAYYNRGLCHHLLNHPVEGCADLMVAEKLGGEKESWLRKQLCD